MQARSPPLEMKTERTQNQMMPAEWRSGAPHRDEDGEPIMAGGKGEGGGVNRRAPLMAMETQAVKEKHLYHNKLSACSCC